MYGFNKSCHNREILEVYRYWRSKARDPDIPARADIDPIEMRKWIAAVLLAEAEFDATGTAIDFFVRVAGSRVGERYGRDLTRRRLSEVSLDKQNANILANHQAPIDTRRATYSINRFQDDAGVLRSFETLLLPLRSHGPACDMVLGVVLPLPSDFDALEGVWIYSADSTT
jgi:hypothetical protein